MYYKKYMLDSSSTFLFAYCNFDRLLKDSHKKQYKNILFKFERSLIKYKNRFGGYNGSGFKNEPVYIIFTKILLYEQPA